MNENSDEDKDEDESWESNIMLKDNRWSVSKGINNRKEEKSLTTTPLITRHNNVIVNHFIVSLFSWKLL